MRRFLLLPPGYFTCVMVNLLVLYIAKKYFRQLLVFRFHTAQTCSKQVWAIVASVRPCRHLEPTAGSHRRPSPAELHRWKATEQEVQQVRPTKLPPNPARDENLRDHRIIEWFGLEGTLNLIWFQPPCHEQGHSSGHSEAIFRHYAAQNVRKWTMPKCT